VIDLKEEQILKLKKLIKDLDSIRGRHTELVSVYVSSGSNLQETISMLRQEYALAQNVKDKTVRKNVSNALEKIIHHLQIFKTTPENGLVVFCGNISEKEGISDIKLWSLEPSEKLTAKVYRCDQVFVLDPLKEMLREREVFGLIVLDAREANVGLLKGKAIEQLKHLESTVPGKTIKGGMSQARYDRLREDAINEFLTKVGESASQLLLKQPDLKGVIIGGPGPVKDGFVRSKYLHHEIQKKLLGTKDTGYTGEEGLQELVKRSSDLIEKAAVVKERELLEKFFTELQKSGNVVYGSKETIKALEQGAIETLLITEVLDLAEVEKLIEKASNYGTKVELISTDTSEGAQFKELGGIGGFLRYKTN